eukprot:jgi/Undpi1/9939/HiC_scaffold_28.g12393.m1
MPLQIENRFSKYSEQRQQEAVIWLVVKHRLDRFLATTKHAAASQDKRRDDQIVASILPETSLLVDQCRQHYAVVTNAEVASITVDGGCPVLVAQELLAAMVALADRDPAKVGGIMRALEHFTRVLFTGGQSDLCAQFLYANLSSNSLGTTSFPATLSEEELNGLLCGRKGYPHVAQLINGCLGSRLSSVRHCAYETLANVALFAKAHRGAKAFDVLLRTRLAGAEKNPRLVAVLAALVWEVVFVDEELQGTRLVGSGTPGSYGLLDDLFDGKSRWRFVLSLSTLWVASSSTRGSPPPAAENAKRDTMEIPANIRQYLKKENEEEEDEEEEDEDEEEVEDEEDEEDEEEGGGGLWSPAPDVFSGTDACPIAVGVCAEQAVLRVSLILHERARKFDSRVRAACRSLATGLRSRKRRARHLLARSALLVVDHGLANGSLDGLRQRFAPAPRRQRGENGQQAGYRDRSFDDVRGEGQPRVFDPYRHMDSVTDDGRSPREMEGVEDGGSPDCLWIRGGEGPGGRGGGAAGDDGAGRGEFGGMGKDALQDWGERRRRGGAGWSERGQGRRRELRGECDRKRGNAVGRGQMLSKRDRTSVTAAMESRLEDYFDGDGGEMLWGEDWLTTEGVPNDFGGHNNVDARAAVAWLVGGVETRHSLLGEG